MTKKEQRSIELARRFMYSCTCDKCKDGTEWRRDLPTKSTPLSPDQLATVRRYNGHKQHLTAETMFLLHHGHGITLSQIEAAGLVCDDAVDYAHLLSGYRGMSIAVAWWKDMLCEKINGNWRPTLTLQELRDDGFSDLAESLRQAIVREWLQGKRDLPPRMKVAEYNDEELQRLAGSQP